MGRIARGVVTFLLHIWISSAEVRLSTGFSDGEVGSNPSFSGKRMAVNADMIGVCSLFDFWCQVVRSVIYAAFIRWLEAGAVVAVR